MIPQTDADHHGACAACRGAVRKVLAPGLPRTVKRSGLSQQHRKHSQYPATPGPGTRCRVARALHASRCIEAHALAAAPRGTGSDISESDSDSSDSDSDDGHGQTAAEPCVNMVESHSRVHPDVQWVTPDHAPTFECEALAYCHGRCSPTAGSLARSWCYSPDA
jgi:hypothetical protein